MSFFKSELVFSFLYSVAALSMVGAYVCDFLDLGACLVEAFLVVPGFFDFYASLCDYAEYLCSRALVRA